MGRPTSCFKIISCAGDLADQRHLQAPENKGSSDKRGWSFRKRSARHRVLNNTVILETAASVHKECPESATNVQKSENSAAPEKFSELQPIEEKPQLLASACSNVSEITVAKHVERKVDFSGEESVAISIQAAVRLFLAQRSLFRLKNVVKLQAAVRGHLVRRHAVGTLRCVQAIVKMQILVRARSAQMSLDKSWGKETIEAESSTTSTLTTKLLSNKFAHQLLESTPKTKRIHIKCDSSRSNSAWKWMERWMSVSTSAITDTTKSELISEKNGQELVGNSSSRSGDCQMDRPTETRENLINHLAENSGLQACSPASSTSLQDKSDHPRSGNKSTSILNETPLSNSNMNSVCVKPDMRCEQTKPYAKRFTPELPESEAKNIALGSRKASNPAFVAAQSKFEELISIANSVRPISSSSQDVIGADTSTRSEELFQAENFIPTYPRLQVGDSECGTEISISSTLDSPEAAACHPITHRESDNVLLYEVNNGALNSVVALESLFSEQKREGRPHGPTEIDSKTLSQAYKSSPEASPRSARTVPESQGTPASQASAKATRSTTSRSGSNRRSKSSPAGNKPSSNPNHDSDSTRVEDLSKDRKSGKRRYSFGSVRPSHGDQDQRDSGSRSCLLPSYMQATESAKAKALANSSPKSSPDVQDGGTYIKKRHSLPGASGRQVSPRIQRSSSQAHAQQGVKGNGTHLQEKKWQR